MSKQKWTNDGDRLTCTIDGRFIATTWQFGGIHQCCVGVDKAWIGLQYQKTLKAAKQHALEWIEAYKKRGPMSVEETFRECYEHWPTLNKTRLDVIDHIMFTNGNGYAWLDGAVSNEGPESHLETKRSQPDFTKKLESKRKEFTEKYGADESKWYRAALLSASEDMGWVHELEKDASRKIPRPFPDAGKPHSFYPICHYAKICNIPDDVRPDWLDLCLEAVLALRDRSGLQDALLKYNKKTQREYAQRNYENRLEAVKLLASILERFPQLKEHPLYLAAPKEVTIEKPVDPTPEELAEEEAKRSALLARLEEHVKRRTGATPSDE